MKHIKFQILFFQAIPLLLWLGFVLLPFLYTPGPGTSAESKRFLENMFMSNLLLLVLFYVHSYALYPWLKKDNGVGFYLVFLAISLAVFLYVSGLFHPAPPPMPKQMRPPGRGFLRPFAYFRVLPFLFVIVCSYCYCLLIDVSRKERELNERENIHLKTELNFLRSQISPHFIFNVFNSMVSLARKQSELLEPSLISISNLMRYMLYETNVNHVSLATEVTYLKNYIDLQLLRYGDTIRLNLYLKGQMDGYMIEPMLLIPFVENAFKHGIGLVDEPLIDVSLDMNQETETLNFVVVNSISKVTDADDGGSGIGLANVERRLTILYPGKHTLVVDRTDALYKVTLMIKLS